MTGREGRRKRIVELSGDASAIRGFVETLTETEPILAAEPLTDLSASQTFVSLVFDASEWNSIAELFAEWGIHYRTGTIIKAGWERWTLYLGSDDDLAALMTEIENRDNDVRLSRQLSSRDSDPSSRFESVEAVFDLTPRQREVLATAITAGYYDYQSGVTLDDVAGGLSVGRATAWEHLQRAEEKVMSHISESLSEVTDT